MQRKGDVGERSSRTAENGRNQTNFSLLFSTLYLRTVTSVEVIAARQIHKVNKELTIS